MRDRYWAALIHVFANCPKLQRYFTTQYIDVNERTVKVQALKALAPHWSKSERFMLNLALHCYSSRNKLDLTDMDYLDSNNRQIAFEALRKRYGGDGL